MEVLLTCYKLIKANEQYDDEHNWENDVQWNLSVTTTSIIKCITRDLFCNVF